MMRFSRLAWICPLFARAAAWAQAPATDAEGGWHRELGSLLQNADATPGFLAAALGVAFLAGAAHALTPGHGKALVAAYLAGSRGTVWDAVYLGSVVTVTHTAAVFVLGLIALYASQRFLVDRIFAWLSVASGALIVAVGLWLFRSRWKALRGGGHGHHHHGHHHHGHGHSHSHEGGRGHTHDAMPRAGRGSLLSLGISGGLVPCPEAMAVLLISFSLQRLAFGLIILVAFSLGLAAVLIAIGVAMVLAGPTLSKVAKDGPFLRYLPVGSAALVTILGVVILLSSLAQNQMVRL